jgi:6-pyruvoyltetrahydropterin/6-carboxytetrahydropterin synthase
MFISTKTYSHNVGLSCCFRQWRAKDSHCRFLHGYALSVKLKFKGELDHRNWVYNFGDLKEVKKWLEDLLDHKTVIAEDDPELETFKQLDKQGLIQLRVIPSVGCEKFSEYIFDYIANYVKERTNDRVKLFEVEVKEHDSNSAIFRKND